MKPDHILRAPDNGGGAAPSPAPAAPTPAPTPAMEPAPSPATLPAASAFDWQGALGDRHGDFAPVVAAKGWKTPADALNAYISLEKLTGSRPATADGYGKLARPDDVPPDTWSDAHDQAFRAAAFEAGLTDSQVGKLHGWYMGGLQRTLATQRQEQERLEPELRQSWGADYDRNLALARRALDRFDAGDLLDMVETKTGAKRAIELFHKIGAAFGEDSLAGNGASPMGGDVRAEIEALNLDPDFTNALWDRQHPGHAEAVRKREDLFKRLPR